MAWNTYTDIAEKLSQVDEKLNDAAGIMRSEAEESLVSTCATLVDIVRTLAKKCQTLEAHIGLLLDK
jgi:ketopantoate hydroxymethyltransferase